MLYTAFIIGLAGSLHCIGMCSPLAMTVTRISSNALISRLIYNFGRIATYGLLGSLVASIGYALPLSQYQNLLSLILGVIFIVASVGSLLNKKLKSVQSLFSKMTLALKRIFSKFLQQKNYAAVFLLGSINGFLPCGLTLLALTSCVILATPTEGFVFMLVFGLGTLPAMIGFSGMLSKALIYFRFNIHSATKAFLFLSGVILIARVFVFHSHDSLSHPSLVDVVMCK